MYLQYIVLRTSIGPDVSFADAHAQMTNRIMANSTYFKASFWSRGKPPPHFECSMSP